MIESYLISKNDEPEGCLVHEMTKTEAESKQKPSKTHKKKAH